MLGILVYCERTGAWAAALRRHLGSAPVAQRQTRSLTECREVLAEFPASLIVLEVTSANLEQALEFLAELPRQFPHAASIAVLQRGLESHQWTIREFGSLAVTNSPRELHRLAPLIRRYFAALPKPAQSWEDQIWSQLPWQPVTPSS